MIDTLLSFTDEAAAQADPVVGKYFIQSDAEGAPPGSWRGDCCVTNVLLWDPADDVTGPPVTRRGKGKKEVVEELDAPPVTTHTPYDDKWRILIALQDEDPELSDHEACELVAHREENRIIKTIFTQEEIDKLKFQPVIAGSNYPFIHR